MSVIVRPYRRGGWEVDIRVVTPDGARQLRERRRAPMSSRSAAMRWAEAREHVLFQRLVDPVLVNNPRKEVPTLQEFAPRFVDGHARANRQKPSGIAAKTAILRLYLIPAFGRRRLDAIKSEDVQRLKAQLEVKSPKTVNNISPCSASEESRGVGCDREDAVQDQAAAHREGRSGVPRLRGV